MWNQCKKTNIFRFVIFQTVSRNVVCTHKLYSGYRYWQILKLHKFNIELTLLPTYCWTVSVVDAAQTI